MSVTSGTMNEDEISPEMYKLNKLRSTNSRNKSTMINRQINGVSPTRRTSPRRRKVHPLKQTKETHGYILDNIDYKRAFDVLTSLLYPFFFFYCR